MISNPFKKEPDDLDLAITDVLARMSRDEADTDKYKSHLTDLDKLMTLKAQQPRRQPISFDTIVKGTVDLVGVGIIVFFEREHVMGSKAFTLLFKRSK